MNRSISASGSRFERFQSVVQRSIGLLKRFACESFASALAAAVIGLRNGAGPRRPNAARALWKESLMTEAVARANVRPVKPDTRPKRPFFSSGPCAKPPGWSPQSLDTSALGRRTAERLVRRNCKRRSSGPTRCCACPPTTSSGSFPPPTPGPWRWRYGHCSGLGQSRCSPGKASAPAGSPTSPSN